MKLHFDSNQEYQIEAIRAVTDIFEGQPLSGRDFEFSLTETGTLLSENGTGNRLSLSEEQIWANIGISATKTKISAKIKIDGNTDKGVVKKSITVKAGTDIYRLSNQREIYRDGFIIDEIDEDIEFYFKLPFWFRINTPIGTYNPDWAIVFKGEKKIYFVAETKGAGQELRPSEQMKIDCGKAHFKQFDDVRFKGPISSVSELV